MTFEVMEILLNAISSACCIFLNKVFDDDRKKRNFKNRLDLCLRPDNNALRHS